jgi:hypothetical protein
MLSLAIDPLFVNGTNRVNIRLKALQPLLEWTPYTYQTAAFFVLGGWDQALPTGRRERRIHKIYYRNQRAAI